MITAHCAVCGSAENLYNHHWVPRSKGGADVETNLITLCGQCHTIIHDRFAINTKELTRLALAHKRELGDRVGGKAPFGYQWVDGRLAINPEENGIITTIMTMRKAGHSLSEIASALQATGKKNRKGTTFSVQGIHKILQAKKGEM